MHSRLFHRQDARYVALQELNGNGKYRKTRRCSCDDGRDPFTSTESFSDLFPDSEPAAPGLRKRLSAALVRSKSSRLPWDREKWKRRASLNRALTSTREVFSRRGSSSSDVEDDGGGGGSGGGGDGKRNRRYSWPFWTHTCDDSAADATTFRTYQAPRLGCVFTIGHSTLFIPF